MHKSLIAALIVTGLASPSVAVEPPEGIVYCGGGGIKRQIEFVIDKQSRDDWNARVTVNGKTIRAMTACGIAWAALSVEDLEPPKALEKLRYDPDPLVRAEAAVALAYFKAEGAKRDVAIAMATIPWQSLDQKRGHRSMVARLASTMEVTTNSGTASLPGSGVVV